MTDIQTATTEELDALNQARLTTAEHDRFVSLEMAFAKVYQSWFEGAVILLEIRDARLYRAKYKTFEQYCRERWKMSVAQGKRLVSAAEVVKNLAPIGAVPTYESQVRPLTKLAPKEQSAMWTRAVETAPNGKITAVYLETVIEHTPNQSTFNKVNENIGWAKWSWNPVTGCLHNCDYCYARDIANRLFKEKFEPTFHPERLAAPENTKLPKKADGDPAWRRVFTCSMADLFGKWVDQTWIKAIFERIERHQEWEFLCLTKFPQRLAELEWPDNVWAGTTVDRQSRVENAERSFAKVKAGVKWLSCEPLLEPLQFTSLAMFDWVVIGASTGSSLAAPFAPPFEWVVDLYNQARASGCKVYLKHNLFGSDGGVPPGMKPVREWPR